MTEEKLKIDWRTGLLQMIALIATMPIYVCAQAWAIRLCWNWHAAPIAHATIDSWRALGLSALVSALVWAGSPLRKQDQRITFGGAMYNFVEKLMGYAAIVAFAWLVR